MSEDFPCDILAEKVINEEYKIWKRNAPFLYDTVMTHALEWPTLTVQWVPGTARHKVLLGTHTSNGEQNYLMAAAVKLPPSDLHEPNEESPSAKGKIEITIKILHQGEINRARAMPQNPFVVATKSPSRDVFIFDMSKHPSVPRLEKGFCPEHRCTGHTREGYGLSWNPLSRGKLLSGSDDAKICLWDINEAGARVPCVTSWGGHIDVVEDVAWHLHCQHVFGSVSDDRRLLLWDSRGNSTAQPIISVEEAHRADINALAFNPQNEYLCISGSADTTVKVWDLRNTSASLHTLCSHQKEVYQIQWAPFSESIVASCGADRRVCVWDLGKIGTQSCSRLDDSPPELVFVHGGHTSKVLDLSWNSVDQWTLASASEDNILQVWKPVRDDCST